MVTVPSFKPTMDKYEQKRLEAEQDGLQPSTLTMPKCVDLIMELTNVTPATIIIDALDECVPAQRHHLFSALTNIVSQPQNVVKILVSGCKEQDIRVRLCHFNQIRLLKRKVVTISEFLQTQIEQATQAKRLLSGKFSSELHKHIVANLTTKLGKCFGGPVFKLRLFVISNESREHRMRSQR